MPRRGFDVSAWELAWALTSGARIVAAAPDGHRDPAYLARTLTTAHITTAHFVPSVLSVFLDSLETTDTSQDGGRLPALRRVVCSGEELTADVAARFNRLLPPRRTAQPLRPHRSLHRRHRPPRDRPGPSWPHTDRPAHHRCARARAGRRAA
ncbi:AMP-binding protein [Streptomyces sp. NPDC007904]|uniref:AMP-binding protein n=1 Tax=Streptomyces sp. NPDC007904 TaxID=3364787 RepID=UPI0036EAAF81